MNHHHHEPFTQNAKEFWDDLYTNRIADWRGKPNVNLVKYAQGLKPGNALDIGCGDSGDAVWLAKNGWSVTSVDVSEVVLRRAKELAHENNVQDLINYEQHDLAVTFPKGTFDLVSAQFFQTPLEFDRAKVLNHAANSLNDNGTFILVDHAASPPWSDHADWDFDTAQQTLDGLQLDMANWEIEVLGVFERQASDPEGNPATLLDNVIVLKRLH